MQASQTFASEYIEAERKNLYVVSFFHLKFLHLKSPEEIFWGAGTISSLLASVEAYPFFSFPNSIEIDSLRLLPFPHSCPFCQDIFLSRPDPVEKVLHNSKIDKSNVPEIVLFNRSTRILLSSKLFPTFSKAKSSTRASIRLRLWCRSSSRRYL